MHGTILSGARGVRNDPVQEDYDQAMSEGKVAVSLNPDSGGAHSLLGCIFLFKHRWDQAATELRLAVNLNPVVADYHRMLGIALEKQGDLQSALAEYLKAYQIDPNNSTYRVTYERLRKELGS